MNITEPTIKAGVWTILERGATKGLGCAERDIVGQLLRFHPTAAHEWHRTHSFVRSEELLSPQACESFLRALEHMDGNGEDACDRQPENYSRTTATPGASALDSASLTAEQRAFFGQLGAFARAEQERVSSLTPRERELEEIADREIAAGRAFIARPLAIV
jgi:hypothetical protein